MHNLYRVKVTKSIGGSLMTETLCEPLVVAETMDQASGLALEHAKERHRGTTGLKVKSVTVVASDDPSSHNPLILKG